MATTWPVCKTVLLVKVQQAVLFQAQIAWLPETLPVETDLLVLCFKDSSKLPLAKGLALLILVHASHAVD